MSIAFLISTQGLLQYSKLSGRPITEIMIRRVTRYKTTAFSLILLALSLGSGHLNSSFAQQEFRIEIPSSFNPVGQGARALGMGGAFIAVADDATAASWNPGGLIQLERPEISVVGAVFWRTEDNDFGTNPEASGDQTVSKSRINFLSAAYPFSLFGLNMVISANYQNLFDLTREWQFPLILGDEDTTIIQDIDYEQEGALGAWGLAYCLQITPSFSFGVTFNLWEDGIEENKWKQTTIQTGTGRVFGDPFSTESKSVDRFTFSGWNANLGILWNVTSKFNFGAVLKTPFTADIKRKSSFSSSINFPPEKMY